VASPQDENDSYLGTGRLPKGHPESQSPTSFDGVKWRKKIMSTQQNRKEFLKLTSIAGFSFLMGSQNLFEQKTAKAAPNATQDHPNVAIIKRYYDAYGKGDIATVREIFAPNIVWRIPGHHPLAGDKRGVDEVLAFFQQLGKAKFKAEVLFLGGNDNYVVDIHRGWSNLT
jgi:uncharacterized protein